VSVFILGFMCVCVIEKGGEIQSTLAEMTGQKTVPNVFISGQHVGMSRVSTSATFISLFVCLFVQYYRKASLPSTPHSSASGTVQSLYCLQLISCRQ